jgi:hypothetical protein
VVAKFAITEVLTFDLGLIRPKSETGHFFWGMPGTLPTNGMILVSLGLTALSRSSKGH